MKIVSGKLTRGSSEAAGYDIHASEDCMIYPNDSVAVPTNLRIDIPHGWVGIIKARSGSSFKYHIETGAGVIDSDYTGEIKVKLYNNSSHVPYKIEKGDKVAQILFVKHYTGYITYEDGSEVEVVNKERGNKGFGSTGK